MKVNESINACKKVQKGQRVPGKSLNTLLSLILLSRRSFRDWADINSVGKGVQMTKQSERYRFI